MIQMDGEVDGGWSRVMFWAGIMGRELVVPIRVSGGVKMTSEKNVAFITDHFLPWYKKNCAFHNEIIFMHDTGPSNAARNTSASLRAYLSSLIGRSMRVGGSSLSGSKKQLGGCPDILQRDSSGNSPKLTGLMDTVKLLSNKVSCVKLDLFRCFCFQ